MSSPIVICWSPDMPGRFTRRHPSCSRPAHRTPTTPRERSTTDHNHVPLPRTTDHYLRSDHQRLHRKGHAENRKVGGSTPPLATSPQVPDLGFSASGPELTARTRRIAAHELLTGSDLPTGSDASSRERASSSSLLGRPAPPPRVYATPPGPARARWMAGADTSGVCPPGVWEEPGRPGVPFRVVAR